MSTRRNKAARAEQVRGTTDFLYARPSFLEGVARLVDIRGSLNVYNHSVTGEEADQRALMMDWKAVGDALRTARTCQTRPQLPSRLAPK